MKICDKTDYFIIFYVLISLPQITTIPCNLETDYFITFYVLISLSQITTIPCNLEQIVLAPVKAQKTFS